MEVLRRIKLFLLLLLAMSYYFLTGYVPTLWSGWLFYRLLRALGPLALKLAQLISVRPDLASPRLSSLLIPLREQVPAIQMELPALIRENPLLLAERNPFACGSMAQVYHGWLKKKGRRLVFKVLKPNLKAHLEADLQLACYLASWVDWLVPNWNSKAVLAELAPSILVQADLEEELSKLHAFARRGFCVPEAYPAFSNKEVLSLQYVETHSATKEEKKQVFITMVAKMLAAPGLIHLDLHPGNVVWCKNESGLQACLLDTGLAEVIPTELHTLFLNTVFSFLRKDASIMAKLFTDEAGPHYQEWRAYLGELLISLKPTTSGLVSFFTSVLRVAPRYSIFLDSRMSKLVMAVTIISGHYSELANPEDDFLRELIMAF